MIVDMTDLETDDAVRRRPGWTASVGVLAVIALVLATASVIVYAGDSPFWTGVFARGSFGAPWHLRRDSPREAAPAGDQGPQDRTSRSSAE